MTVAVWVGYAGQGAVDGDRVPGGPVAGGTFPAEIWHDFMTSAVAIRDARDAASGKDDGEDEDRPTAATCRPTPVDPSDAPDAEQRRPTTPAAARRAGHAGSQRRSPKTPAARRHPPPRPPPSRPAAGRRRRRRERRSAPRRRRRGLTGAAR